MASFAGIRGTGDWGTDERPKNFREAILWREPNGMAPLTALMARMASEKTDDPEFAWWEEQLDQVRITTTADLSTTSTTVTTASGGLLLVAGDVLLIEKVETASYTSEVAFVSSVTSDTSFVIKRGQAGTSGQNALTGTKMTRIGSAFEEGTGGPGAASRNPTKLRNYTQIFKKTIDITNTADATRARTGDAWNNDRKRKMFDLAADMELAAFWGTASEVTGPVKGKPMRTTAGLRSFITTNAKIYTTTPTSSDFLDFCQGIFNYSGDGINDERFVFCGNGFLNSLNKLVKADPSSRVVFNGGKIEVYKLRLLEYAFPYGTLGFKTHPLFNTHGLWNYSAFILHGKNILERVLRPVKFIDNVQANDSDERAGQWRGELGFEFHHENTMGYIGNFLVP